MPPLDAPSRAARRPVREDEAFERWLRVELGRLYDQTLREPVPASLLQILREAEGTQPKQD